MQPWLSETIKKHPLVTFFILAFALTWISGLPLAASILGMAPGGMPEMTITAKALEVGVPLVLGFHLVRTLICNVFVEPIWRLARRIGG